MLVLSNPYFYYIKSSIKGKSFSYVNSYRYYSIVNGRPLSLCSNSKYRSSSITGIDSSK